jgi:hypothetical protein
MCATADMREHSAARRGSVGTPTATRTRGFARNAAAHRDRNRPRRTANTRNVTGRVQSGGHTRCDRASISDRRHSKWQPAQQTARHRRTGVTYCTTWEMTRYAISRMLHMDTAHTPAAPGVRRTDERCRGQLPPRTTLRLPLPPRHVTRGWMAARAAGPHHATADRRTNAADARLFAELVPKLRVQVERAKALKHGYGRRVRVATAK